MKTVLIAFVLVGLAFIGIAIRILFVKNGKFKGTCASQNQNLNNANEPCGFCGKMPEDCENESS